MYEKLYRHKTYIEIFYYSDKVFDFLAQHVYYIYIYFFIEFDAEFGIIIEAS